MPVVMRTSYTGSGDTFKYYQDGRSPDAPANVIHVDAKDLSPADIQGLEAMDAQFRQREMQRPPADVWRGQPLVRATAGADTLPPASPAAPSWAQEIPGVQGGMSPVGSAPVTGGSAMPLGGSGPLSGPAAGSGTFGGTQPQPAGGRLSPLPGASGPGLPSSFGAQSPGIPPAANNPYNGLPLPQQQMISGQSPATPPAAYATPGGRMGMGGMSLLMGLSGAGPNQGDPTQPPGGSAVPQTIDSMGFTPLTGPGPQAGAGMAAPLPGTPGYTPGYVPGGHPTASGAATLGAKPLLPATQTPAAQATQTPVTSSTNTLQEQQGGNLGAVASERMGSPILPNMEGQTFGGTNTELTVVRQAPDGLLLEIDVMGKRYVYDTVAQRWIPAGQ